MKSSFLHELMPGYFFFVEFHSLDFVKEAALQYFSLDIFGFDALKLNGFILKLPCGLS